MAEAWGSNHMKINGCTYQTMSSATSASLTTASAINVDYMSRRKATTQTLIYPGEYQHHIYVYCSQLHWCVHSGNCTAHHKMPSTTLMAVVFVSASHSCHEEECHTVGESCCCSSPALLIVGYVRGVVSLFSGRTLISIQTKENRESFLRCTPCVSERPMDNVLQHHCRELVWICGEQWYICSCPVQNIRFELPVTDWYDVFCDCWSRQIDCEYAQKSKIVYWKHELFEAKSETPDGIVF